MKTMYTPERRRLRLLFQILIVLASLAMVLVARAQSTPTTVSTDQSDYPPGSTAYITGSGFQPGEAVSLQVLHVGETSDNATSGAHAPWNVVADSLGNFSSSWLVPYDEDELGATLLLLATGQNSGTHAEWTFTDGQRDLSSLSVGVQAGTVTYGSSATPTFIVTVNTTLTGGGTGNLNGINLSVTGLPSGVIGAFSPTSLNASNGTPSPTSTLTITTTNLLNAGSYNFTVNASFTQGNNTTSVQNTGTLTISKAIQVINWNAPASITYGTLLSATQLNATVTGVSGGSPTGVLTYSPAAGTLLNAGTQTLQVDAVATSNYNAATKTVSIVVNKANQTITWNNPANIIYGTSLSGIQLNATVVGVSGGTAAGPLTYTPASGTSLNAGTQTLQVDAAATTNYNAATKQVTLIVDKSPSTTVITIAPGTFTYTGSALTPATVSVTGAGGLNLSPTSSYANNTNAGTATASYTYAGDANHLNSSDSKNFTINKATSTTVVTINGGPFTYTGSAQTPATVSVTGAGGLNLTPTADYANNTNAGTATASYIYAGDANHTGSSDSKDFTIGKVNATVTVTGFTGTYDATSHGATGSATGVLNETLSGLNLGASFTDVPGGTANWTFTDATGNYNDSNGSVTIVINKANAIVTVDGYTGVYDAAAHGASGSVAGVAGDASAAGSSLDLGESFTNAPGGTVNWAFTGGTNYNDQSGSVAITIAKADVAVTVNGYSGTYDALSHGVTGSASGVGGIDLTSGLNLGLSFTDAPGGTAHWTFTGGTNYNDKSGDAVIEISKANAVVSVSGYSGTYDGAMHGAMGSATGVGGVALSGLDLGLSFTNVPGGTASWTFAGGTNYNDQSGDVSIVIQKANAVISVVPYSVTYNGTGHTASGSAIGVQGESLSGLDLSLTTHTHAGTTNDAWTFTDVTGNYADASGFVTDNIDKANASIAVTPYNVTYNAAAHTATGTALGVQGESLSGLDLSLTTHTHAGTTNDAWTFTDVTGNYTDASGFVTDNIDKADASIVVTPYNVTYDATSYTATGTALGVQGESLAGLDLSLTTHTNAGTTNDSWTFTDVTGNYTDASGSVNNNIGKADALVTVAGYTGVYDAAGHGATGSVAGVARDASAAGSSLDLGISFTNVPGGTVNWTFTGGANYNDQAGTAEIVITPAGSTVSVGGGTFDYDGSSHTATGFAYGLDGVSDVLSPAVTFNYSGITCSGSSYNSSEAPIAPGVYNVVASFSGNTNYSGSSGTATVTILDTVNPTITALANVSVTTNTACTATGVSLGTPVTADNCSVVSVTNNAPSAYPLGTTTVTWTVKDAAGNSAIATQTVTVTDNVNPTITAPANVNATTNTACTATGVSLGTPATADNCSVASVTNNAPSAYPLGTTTVTWTVKDVAGNFATATQTVTVTDNVKPVLVNIPANIVLSSCIAAATWVAPSATDNCSGAVTVAQTAGPASGSTFANGTSTTISYQATDAAGNQSSVGSFTVTRASVLTSTVTNNNPVLYFGYSGDQTSTISVTPSGGTGPYKVIITMSRPLLCNQITSAGDELWTPSGGTTTGTAACPGSGTAASAPSSSITSLTTGSYSVNVTLMTDAAITVIVEDANHCTTTSTTNIHAEDVRCFAGNSTVTKISVCHKTGSAKNPCVAICIDESALNEHLAHGDFVGKCTTNCVAPANAEIADEGSSIMETSEMESYPNPFKATLSVKVSNPKNENVSMHMIDLTGRVIEFQAPVPNDENIYKLDTEKISSGFYVLRVNIGSTSKLMKVIKE